MSTVEDWVRCFEDACGRDLKQFRLWYVQSGTPTVEAKGEYDAATQIYWQLHPARKVKSALAQVLYGGAFINRQAWKFQGWLQGYNGGPLRQPTQRIHEPQMFALRKGLIDAGTRKPRIANVTAAPTTTPADRPARPISIGRATNSPLPWS